MSIFGKHNDPTLTNGNNMTPVDIVLLLAMALALKSPTLLLVCWTLPG